MRGEVKLLIFGAMVVVAAVLNVMVDRYTGWDIRTFTGMFLGCMLYNIWPGLMMNPPRPQPPSETGT